MSTRARLASITALAAFLGASLPAFADDAAMNKAVDAALGDHTAYRTLIDTLQTAIKAHDAAGVAALVAYPIGVTIKGKKITIKTAKDFVAHYEDIVTPAIAAAVQDQPYADMMVNWQGIMLGRGEIWVNGICPDSACKTYTARVVTIQPTDLDAPAGAAAAEPAATEIQPSKQFKAWAAGCDNLRSCTALGMISDTDKGAYIKISRGGAADAQPRLTITVDNEDEPKAPSLKLGLAGGDLPAGSTPKVESDGAFVTGALEGDDATAFIAALRNAKSLDVTVVDGGKQGASATVPLSGLAAALLYIDDAQKRLDTVTALSKPGSAAASTVPPQPTAPEVKSVKMIDVANPAPPRPKGVAAPPADSGCTSDYADTLVMLSDKLTLRGVCNFVAAYNIDYTYWIVGDGQPKLADFPTPGRKSDSGPGILTNGGVSEDGLTIGVLQKGEGIGDCGVTADWAWDGKAFQLVGYTEMNECRGVLIDDWPVLYTAKYK